MKLLLAAMLAVTTIQPGTTYHGEGTYYGATGQGNCSYDPGGDTAIAALNHTDYAGSALCGAYLRATGPRGTVTVKVVDRCPECAPGDIDFSAQAFARVADPAAGRVPISWQLVSPEITGPLAFRYKEGSTRWWCGIQVRNHRNPVTRLEAQTATGWRELTRTDYNYFLSPDGAGCGTPLRITDLYGQALTQPALPITPGVDQAGTAQFSRH
ncbi:expansin EXLX1 family cellulose-binding protein [Saccharothrix syringae]|uniref:Lipoprotein A-like protein n=1 Tax=Saccharothrix syringae TaxID=103733 RepID=A0A5Q0H562_SACSY|nr:expansin EXLX1 family cellulose-binding protein [Saccharothrix syringae]QFZ20872.1 lipoprotein A-like protein [Saccharothrix syringae]